MLTMCVRKLCQMLIAYNQHVLRLLITQHLILKRMAVTLMHVLYEAISVRGPAR